MPCTLTFGAITLILGEQRKILNVEMETISLQCLFRCSWRKMQYFLYRPNILFHYLQFQTQYVCMSLEYAVLHTFLDYSLFAMRTTTQKTNVGKRRKEKRRLNMKNFGSQTKQKVAKKSNTHKCTYLLCQCCNFHRGNQPFENHDPCTLTFRCHPFLVAWIQLAMLLSNHNLHRCTSDDGSECIRLCMSTNLSMVSNDLLPIQQKYWLLITIMIIIASAAATTICTKKIGCVGGICSRLLTMLLLFFFCFVNTCFEQVQPKPPTTRTEKKTHTRLLCGSKFI